MYSVYCKVKTVDKLLALQEVRQLVAAHALGLLDSIAGLSTLLPDYDYIEVRWPSRDTGHI